jgi:glutathione S-transferase
MKLFGSYTSPFVRHCRIVLLETGFTCDFIETDQAGSAAQSPTKRVPFLQDGDAFFTDSSSIIKYLREKAVQEFCSNAKELDEYCMVNTTLDTTVNIFFLERDGVKADDVPYIQRQISRIESSLHELNNLQLPMSAPYNDAQLRLACFIGWAKFRSRAGFSPIETSEYKNLEAFFAGAQTYAHFKNTEPRV